MTLVGLCPICVQDALYYYLASSFVLLTFLGRKGGEWVALGQGEGNY